MRTELNILNFISHYKIQVAENEFSGEFHFAWLIAKIHGIVKLFTRFYLLKVIEEQNSYLLFINNSLKQTTSGD